MQELGLNSPPLCRDEHGRARACRHGRGGPASVPLSYCPPDGIRGPRCRCLLCAQAAWDLLAGPSSSLHPRPGAREGFLSALEPYTRPSAPAVELAESGEWVGVYPSRSLEVLLADFGEVALGGVEALEEDLISCVPFFWPPPSFPSPQP